MWVSYGSSPALTGRWVVTIWCCADLFIGLSCAAVPGLARSVLLPGAIKRVRSVMAHRIVLLWSMFTGTRPSTKRCLPTGLPSTESRGSVGRDGGPSAWWLSGGREWLAVGKGSLPAPAGKPGASWRW